MRKPFMTSQATRRQDVANRKAVGNETLRGKPPMCVEITPRTRASNGVVKMCTACYGTSVAYHMGWIAATCGDCGSLRNKIGGFWILKRPARK